MRIIGHIDTSRYFLKITDGKVRINGKMVELTGIPSKMKSAACFTQVGSRTFASAYSENNGLEGMSFGKKLMLTDMTTRRSMDSEDPALCIPGRFPLYILAAGKTDYFSIYKRVL